MKYLEKNIVKLMIIEKNYENNIEKFTERRSKLLYGFLKNYNSRATQESYRADLELFLKFLLKQFQKTEFSLDHAHAVAYKNYLIESGFNQNTINRRIASASAYLEYLVQEGVREKNPFLRVKRFPKINVGKTQAIEMEYLKNSLSKINRDNLTGLMRYALLLTLFNTGIRVSELCNLKLSSLERDELGILIKVKIKGGKFHKVYLPRETVNSIYEYLSARSERFGDLSSVDFLFVSFSNNCSRKLHRSSVNYIFKQVFKESTKKLYPHSSRATFVTEVIKEEGVSSAQKRVGHLDPRTTSIYDKGNISEAFSLFG